MNWSKERHEDVEARIETLRESGLSLTPLEAELPDALAEIKRLRMIIDRSADEIERQNDALSKVWDFVPVLLSLARDYKTGSVYPAKNHQRCWDELNHAINKANQWIRANGGDQS